MSEKEQIELDNMKFQSGTYSPNEIREDRGNDPWPETEYDRPQQGVQGQAGDNQFNPMFTQDVTNGR